MLTALVVDADSDSREAVYQLLTLEGFHVLTARSGDEAVLLLRGVPEAVRCVVLLDLATVPTTAAGTVEAIVRLQGGARFPIVAIADEHVLDEVRRLPGVAATVRKPFDPAELLSVATEHAYRLR